MLTGTPCLQGVCILQKSLVFSRTVSRSGRSLKLHLVPEENQHVDMSCAIGRPLWSCLPKPPFFFSAHTRLLSLPQLLCSYFSPLVDDVVVGFLNFLPHSFPQ